MLKLVAAAVALSGGRTYESAVLNPPFLLARVVVAHVDARAGTIRLAMYTQGSPSRRPSVSTEFRGRLVLRGSMPGIYRVEGLPATLLPGEVRMILSMGDGRMWLGIERPVGPTPIIELEESK